MADKGLIAVVGAGLAGLSAAARLRALGHPVLVIEARPELPKPDLSTEADRLSFTGLGAWRELFSVTGTALDAALSERGFFLQPAPPSAHRFADGRGIELPTERGGQLAAITETLGVDAAHAWGDLLTRLDDVAEVVAQLGQAQPFTRSRLTSGEMQTLQVGHSLADLAAALPCAELGEVVLDTAAWLGQRPQWLPAWQAYRLTIASAQGRWRLVDHAGAAHPPSELAAALVVQLGAAGVEFHLDEEAVNIRRGPLVRTTAGTLSPAAVISTVSPFTHADLTRERPDQKATRQLWASPSGGPLWRGWRTLFDLPKLEPSLPRVVVASAWSPGGADAWAQLLTGRLAAQHLSAELGPLTQVR
jgi:phytoene dehydrogenase-like protein